MIKQKLDTDLKAALLAHHSLKVSTLRGLKSVILYEEVARGKREEGLEDDTILTLMAKEVKKRQESADLYIQGGNQERADKELLEKTMIEAYLPKQLSESEIVEVVNDVINELSVSGMQAMGQVIGIVKAKVGPSADGATVARIVKERLAS